VLRQASLLFFIASGLTLVVLTAGLDLSVGANVALSACLAGTVIQRTGSPLLGILTGLLSGIPVSRRLLLVYCVSGTMAGLASIIFLARLNSAEADIGESLTLPAIAAVLIGGTSLFGGVGTVFGTFIGALILTLVLNGMNLLSVNANWQPFITGVIVIVAVWLDMTTRRHKL